MTAEQAMATATAYLAHPGDVLKPAVESAVTLLEMGHVKAALDLLKRALVDARIENYHRMQARNRGGE